MTLFDRNISADFLVRIWFSEEVIEEVQAFVFELKGIAPEYRDSEQWVENHFRDLYSVEDLFKTFGITEGGDYQVVAKGTVTAWKDRDTPNGPGEWDEESDIESFLISKVSREERN